MYLYRLKECALLYFSFIQFTNICSTDSGREVFATDRQALEARSNLKSSSNDTPTPQKHHETAVDQRDVVEVTVKAMLDGDIELLRRAAGLVYNISMAKVCLLIITHQNFVLLGCLNWQYTQPSFVK